MPKLWDATIEAHRQAVREATLDTTAALVIRDGLASVTMSQIAKETGIGRATLYKYFPDVESILVAWHERQIAGHLSQLMQIGHGAGNARSRLEASLEVVANGVNTRGGTELAALLHGGGHLLHAQAHLKQFLTDLITEAAADGDLRDDVPPSELASYCLNALSGAAGLRSRAAVTRLVAVTLSGLSP